MMRWRGIAVACGLAICANAGAHRIDEYLQATILSLAADRIKGAMRLLPGEQMAAVVIASIDTDGDGAFSAAEQRAYAQRVLHDLSPTVDGVPVAPRLTDWTFPPPSQMRQGLGEIHIGYTIDLPARDGMRSFVLNNHHMSERSVYLANVLVPRDPGTRVLEQKRDAGQASYRVDFRAAADPDPFGRGWIVDLRATWSRLEWTSLFRLGMRHIADGSDHLMFLLVLLLPAPLIATGRRWGGSASARHGATKALTIVTAFTVGHSISLSLAASGGLSLPPRMVETLVALSILVSAVHALRPIFPGREPVVAAVFGLVHGLAFAATLGRLGASLGDRVAGTLVFNLGIEAMQLLVVAAVLPSLLLIAKRPVYRVLRIGGAAFAIAASAGWIGERLFDLPLRVDAVVDALAQHAILGAVMLLVVAIAGLPPPWAADRRMVPGIATGRQQ